MFKSKALRYVMTSTKQTHVYKNRKAFVQPGICKNQHFIINTDDKNDTCKRLSALGLYCFAICWLLKAALYICKTQYQSCLILCGRKTTWDKKKCDQDVLLMWERLRAHQSKQMIYVSAVFVIVLIKRWLWISLVVPLYFYNYLASIDHSLELQHRFTFIKTRKPRNPKTWNFEPRT